MQVSSVSGYNPNFKASIAKNYSRDEINSYFEEKMKPLKMKRFTLLRLDSFFESKSVKCALNKFPKEDEIFIQCNNMDIDDTRIIYNPANKESMAKFDSIPIKDAVNIAFYNVKTENGELDESSLSAWFDNLRKFLGK